jgi:putative hemolysin
MNQLLEVLVILLLLAANGVFAMSELAVMSARKARLLHMAERGNRKAAAALELIENPNQFLATVQIGITLVGILAGAFGGATLSRSLAAALRPVAGIGPYADPVAFAVVVIGITYLSLVVGELVPKRLALNNAEGIAAAVAPSMRILSRFAAPVVHVLSASTDGFLRLLGVRSRNEPPVTEEEIKVLIGQGAEAGVFEQAEEELVRRVFRTADLRVAALMTPRPEIDWLDVEDSPEELKARIAASPHTRFPVARGTVDEIVGVVAGKDLLSRCLAGAPLDLASLCRPPLFAPEGMKALRALEMFKAGRDQLAIVVDEFGGVQGLVTLTDVLEAIVGEMPAAGEEEREVLRREDGTLLIDAAVPVAELKELLRLRSLPEEADASYHTVAGFVLERLSRIPVTGDAVEWEGHRFEVVDMDGRRIDKVLVTPPE